MIERFLRVVILVWTVAVFIGVFTKHIVVQEVLTNTYTNVVDDNGKVLFAVVNSNPTRSYIVRIVK